MREQTAARRISIARDGDLSRGGGKLRLEHLRHRCQERQLDPFHIGQGRICAEEQRVGSLLQGEEERPPLHGPLRSPEDGRYRLRVVGSHIDRPVFRRRVEHIGPVMPRLRHLALPGGRLSAPIHRPVSIENGFFGLWLEHLGECDFVDVRCRPVGIGQDAGEGAPGELHFERGTALVGDVVPCGDARAGECIFFVTY